MRVKEICLVCSLCALGLVASSLASAQGAIKSGIRGKVTIAPRLVSAAEWPVDEAMQAKRKEPARVRRPSPYGVLGTATEPAPKLSIVLEGVKSRQAPSSTVTFDGLRFSPQQVLVVLPGKLIVKNLHPVSIDVTGAGGKVLASVPTGGQAEVELEAGELELSVREFDFVQLGVRVLKETLFLPVQQNGNIPPIPVESGDYKIGFYHGATPLLVQPLTIPAGTYQAVVASVSDNRVVTMSVKDGGLQLSVPPRPIPTPPAPVEE